jgi:DNA-binding IclR family transcriptional regulator
MFGLLAARAIEVLVTHNEPVNCDDLACALGVTDADAWTVATRLRTLGYVTLDERQATVEATALAADLTEQRRRDELLRAVEEH